MNRRQSIGALATAGIAASLEGAAGKEPIQLHVDLEVAPGKDAELVKNFKTIFKPTISRQPGFVEVKLMKFRKAMVGNAPAGLGYRLLISFQTEEQRTTWVASADHQKVWPTIEGTLTGKKFSAMLFDLA